MGFSCMQIWVFEYILSLSSQLFDKNFYSNSALNQGALAGFIIQPISPNLEIGHVKSPNRMYFACISLAWGYVQGICVIYHTSYHSRLPDNHVRGTPPSWIHSLSPFHFKWEIIRLCWQLVISSFQMSSKFSNL